MDLRHKDVYYTEMLVLEVEKNKVPVVPLKVGCMI